MLLCATGFFIEIVLDHFFCCDNHWLNDSIFNHLKAGYISAHFVDVLEVKAQIVVLSGCFRLWTFLAFFYLFIECLFPLFHGFLSLHVVELLKRLLSKVNFGLLINLDFSKNLLVLILSIEEECPHHLFEQMQVFDLEALAAREAEGIIEE